MKIAMIASRFVRKGTKIVTRGFGNRKNFSSEGATLQAAFRNSVGKETENAKVVNGVNGDGKNKEKIEMEATTSLKKDKKDDFIIDFEDSAEALALPIDKKVEINHPRAQFSQGYIQEFAPRICVVGVGGGGCNAVNNMISRGLSGVEFICANTDAQHLSATLTEKRLQLGRDRTSGLGCGANPEVGRAAAQESKAEIEEMIGDAHMVFITAGMGGGTGTGAAPVVAEVCMEKGILTVAVVTKPFSFEGRHRARLASEGMMALQDRTDTLIAIPNQNLFKLIDQSTSVMDAFGLADDVLLAGVKSITDLMVRPGLINLDFADVQSVMSGMGNSIMGTGQADGEDRAVRAASDALKNPLLGSDTSIRSAKGMLVNITGGSDLTLFEVDSAAQHITQEIEDENANIIFGSSFDPSVEGSIRVSVVATGIDDYSLNK